VLTLALPNEEATTALGVRLAIALRGTTAGLFVTLAGELGAGKTTLVRGLLRQLGVQGAIRSPTYAVLETYPVAGGHVHHLDWYRLATVRDLEGLGFRDLLGAGQWVFVEWPDRAPAVAATADLCIELRYAPVASVEAQIPGSPEVGRSVTVSAQTLEGEQVLKRFIAG
jgi:tRNA threonylcarbamoyladenosine biosynthesis protein TsaE